MTDDEQSGDRALTVTVTTSGLEPQAVEQFHVAADIARTWLTVLASSAQCPPLTVDLLATIDFVADVQAALDQASTDHPTGGDTHNSDGTNEGFETGYPPFTAERLGGLVAAKNIPLSYDGSMVRIVFNGALYDTCDPLAQLIGINLAAHELTHPVLGRLRCATDAGLSPLPAGTPRHDARSICRGAIDELRCDHVADLILTNCGHIGDGEQRRPIRCADLFGEDGHRGGLLTILDDVVWPGLPRLVRAYQDGQIDLHSMWKQVVETTDQLLTVLAHAQAEAHSAGDNTLLPAGVTHPAMEHLIEPVWQPIMTVLAPYPVLPPLPDFAAVEADVLQVGEAAILGFWQRLGLTFKDVNPDGGFHIDVATPAHEDLWAPAEQSRPHRLGSLGGSGLQVVDFDESSGD